MDIMWYFFRDIVQQTQRCYQSPLQPGPEENGGEKGCSLGSWCPGNLGGCFVLPDLGDQQSTYEALLLYTVVWDPQDVHSAKPTILQTWHVMKVTLGSSVSTSCDKARLAKNVT